jgi:hypothetical protein
MTKIFSSRNLIPMLIYFSQNLLIRQAWYEADVDLDLWLRSKGGQFAWL